MILDLLQYAGMTAGLAGAFLLAFKRPFAGHVVWSAGNPCWVAFGLMTEQWGLAAQFTAFTGLAIAGALNWRRRRDRGT